jgi:glucose-1-phosphate thymidylyltransferase
MIYGLIPVGGKGTRLSLPFSKEMLPQKHYDYYNPVINHTVEKMFLAGASKIYMVHGTELKEDIVSFYENTTNIIHIKQTEPSFAGVLSDFVNTVKLSEKDKVLFGLPDSVYDKNPFVEMLTLDGIVCGLFHGDNNIKADRPTIGSENIFQIKTVKNETNLDWFWGILKFDGKDLLNMKIDSTEIGTIINRYFKTYVYGNMYIDLGTWLGYNKYITTTESFGNTEVEKKYNSDNVLENDLKSFIRDYLPEYKEYKYIPNTIDYYYTNNNPIIEFIRYRDGGTDEALANPNITIKNFNNSQLNRFELTIPINKSINSKEDVLHFISLLNCELKYKVDVTCHIYYSEEAILVMYWFMVGNKKVSLIEIELKSMDFNIITRFENLADKHLKGFNSGSSIAKSKFQLIKELYDKN